MRPMISWWQRWTMWLWVVGFLGLVGLLTTLVFVWKLYPGAPSADQLAAASALLGGFIGAGGTAFAVYLTLASQRRDEAQEVESALRAEVSELARLALGLVQLCDLVMNEREGYKIPLRDLPVVMSMPDAPIFRSTADRISRLAYGSLFVVLHARIAEALQLVRMTAAAGAQPPSFSSVGRIAEVQAAMATPAILKPEGAKTLSVAWTDVCLVARTILRRDPMGFALAEASMTEVLKDLDTLQAREPPA